MMWMYNGVGISSKMHCDHHVVKAWCTKQEFAGYKCQCWFHFPLYIMLQQDYQKLVICFLYFCPHVRYRKLFNKKSKKWSLFAIKENKDYKYIADLQRAVVTKQLSSGRGLSRQTTKRPDDPRRHGVLSGVPAPTIQELLETQVSRGDGKTYIPYGCSIGKTITIVITLFLTAGNWSEYDSKIPPSLFPLRKSKCCIIRQAILFLFYFQCKK